MKKKISLCILVLCIVCSAICGCGASSDTATTDESIGQSNIVDQSEPGDYEKDDDAGSSVTVPGDSRKIVYQSSIYMQTSEFDDTIAKIKEAVKASDGYISYSSFDGTESSGRRSVSYSCRVSVENYSTFIDRVSEAGTVSSLNENTQDVTSEYIDTEARIKSLKAQEERLYALMDEAGSLENLIAVQDQLTEVQYQIESYTSQLNALKDRVSYSTVDIEVIESGVFTPSAPEQDSFGSRIVLAFQNMWDGFVSGLQEFVILLIYALPGLLIIAIIVVIVLAAVKHSKKKARSRVGTSGPVNIEFIPVGQALPPQNINPANSGVAEKTEDKKTEGKKNK